MSSSVKYRADIDGLRAIAVLAVVLHHAHIPGFSGGFVGVDVFFVISGYLITSIIKREIEAGSFSLADFYKRRILRILPALMTVLLSTTILSYVFLIPSDFENYARSMEATAAFFSNFYFWSQTGYFAGPAVEMPLLHTWSLAVEEQFYLFWPLLLPFILKNRFMLFVWLLGISFFLSVWMVDRNSETAFFLTPFRAWELGAGALLAWVPLVSSKTIGRQLSNSGLVLIFLSVVFLTPYSKFPGIYALPAILGSMAIIVSGRSELLATKLFVFIGKVSYSFYLWHWPLLAFANYRLMRAPTAFEGLIIVSFSFALAVFSTFYIERPFRKGKFQTPTVLVRGSVALLIVIISGMVIIKLNDMQKLWPEEVYNADAVLEGEIPYFDCINHLDIDSSDFINDCSIGDGEVKAVLWGDSHSLALAPIFSNYQFRTLLLSRNTCPPILDVLVIFSNHRGRYDECRDSNEKVFNFIVSSEDIGLVFLYARWNLYLSGEPMPNENHPFVYIADGDVPFSSKENGRQYFLLQLREMLETLESAGKKVMLILPTPEFGTNSTRCVLLRNENCELPIDTYLARRHDFVEEVRQYDNVNIIDFLPFLCDDVVCFAKRGGYMFYRDDDHLSSEGAAYLAAPLEQRLVELGIVNDNLEMN